MSMEQLEQALRAGGQLHAFRSGGGLRVVRVERDAGLVAYGEHPHMGDALRLAGEDYAAGQQCYNPTNRFEPAAQPPTAR